MARGVELVPVEHPVIRRVETNIFFVQMAPDCMVHECRCIDEGGRVLLDACCQHGADCDSWERDAILDKKDLIAPILEEPFRDPSLWFDESAPQNDPDFPSGVAVRTATAGAEENSGCVFLQQDRRGCAIHRASLEHGFSLKGVKPMVCQLFPLTFGEGALLLSDDFTRYSCANLPDAPTLYRVQRGVIASVWDDALVQALDRVERELYRKRLRIVA